MRKALVVGIDYYTNVKQLNGCVRDAHEVKGVLERHADGSLNFGVKLAVATNQANSISRLQLKELARELFKDDGEISLFYFSGHGYIESSGGYLITSECTSGDDGFPMEELLLLANESKAQNKIVILDCCHAGAVGSPVAAAGKAFLNEGVTILTASAANQYSIESGGAGVFTTLLVDALNGSAANLVGDITPGSVYAHIDQSLGPWEQRPLFKTNVKRFISLREVLPPISLEDLKQIIVLFPDPAAIHPLDPTYEPSSASANPIRVEQFATLQKYSHVNLVKPVDEEHMYYAAMNSTGCRLTVLGVHYWNLVSKDRI